MSEQELKQQLVIALQALASMWGQHCYNTTPYLLGAGEETKDVLAYWGLLNSDDTAIYLPRRILT